MKRGFVVILLIVALFITSCETTDKADKLKPFIGGLNGLKMEFVADEPPDEVLDDSQESFFINVLVKNEGEFDIPEGGVIGTLSGINRETFGIEHLSYKSAFSLMGKKKEEGFVREGEEQEFQFGEAMYRDDLLADFKTKMMVDMCYRYGTVGVGTLCLKRNVAKTNRRDVCTVKNEKVTIDSSSAPVQVTEMRQMPAGANAIRFLFTVENKGNGDVYQPNAFSDFCADSKEIIEDEVYVTVTSPSGDIDAKCNALGDDDEGAVRLVNGKKQISCTVDTSKLQITAYNDLVYVNLDYFYRTAIVKDITIENAVV